MEPAQRACESLLFLNGATLTEMQLEAKKTGYGHARRFFFFFTEHTERQHRCACFLLSVFLFVREKLF